MTREGRMIGAKIYAAASEAERKTKNVKCYYDYYDELKDDLDPKVEETVKVAEKAPKQVKKGAK